MLLSLHLCVFFLNSNWLSLNRLLFSSKNQVHNSCLILSVIFGVSLPMALTRWQSFRPEYVTTRITVKQLKIQIFIIPFRTNFFSLHHNQVKLLGIFAEISRSVNFHVHWSYCHKNRIFYRTNKILALIFNSELFIFVCHFICKQFIPCSINGSKHFLNTQNEQKFRFIQFPLITCMFFWQY